MLCDVDVQHCFVCVPVKGRPKHMTAFFCVKLFEICMVGMAMLSYFSSTDELRHWIAAQVVAAACLSSFRKAFKTLLVSCASLCFLHCVLIGWVQGGVSHLLQVSVIIPAILFVVFCSLRCF